MAKILLIVSLSIFLISGSFLNAAAKDAQSLYQEYDNIIKKFEEKVNKVKSRKEYRELIKEKEQKLTALLEEVGKQQRDDDLDLLTGKILLDLDKKVAALARFEYLIKKNSTQNPQAKFGKVRILLGEEKYKEALALFQQVEDKVKVDDNYLMAIFELAYEAQELDTRERYSRQFITAAADREDAQNYAAMMHENLAAIAKERGNLDKGIQILEEAAAKMKNERAKAGLQETLKQFKLINGPAPAIKAEVWINPQAQTLQELKGRVVLIDFWAPWCGPCRRVIPTLVENYKKYKDKGLVVIGFTRLYGRYSDDKINKGKVPREEEIRLIREFLDRFKITYPIAIADGKEIFEAYSVSGIPTLIFIDKAGNVHDIEVGSGSKDTLEKVIKSLL